MSFKYCDPCARELKLPELAARVQDDCDNCDAINVVCNLGDKKPKKKAAPKAKPKTAAKAKSKPKAKAKPKASSNAKGKKVTKGKAKSKK